MSNDLSTHRNLAQRRTDTRLLVDHLRFPRGHCVAQALVKDALLRGLSQSETAKLLGMSKRTVNQHARTPYRRYAVSSDDRATERRSFDAAFMAYFWGSDEAARAATERSIQYDRERLLVESD